jgi:hypothetical protein
MNPVTILIGVAALDGTAGKGYWRRRKLYYNGNGPDTGSRFARRESEQTSSNCLVVRQCGKPSQARK